MSSDVDAIARAVLYEGYLLYPYRPSALKNQQRWSFGVLYPAAWAAQQAGSDRSYFQVECVALALPDTYMDVSVRFLQIVERDTVERRVTIESLPFSDLARNARAEGFPFETEPIKGQIQFSATELDDGVFRLTVRVSNTSDCLAATRDSAISHSLVSAHAVLHLNSGEFVSQTDPPEELSVAVAACQNVGVWPVLVGETGAKDTMLASPIILSDYPQVAPESKGDLFDATEIDEILTLRILTLTDAEKEEVRRSDERARRILERLENSPPEHLLELHGTIRGMQKQTDAWSSWDTLAGSPRESAAVSGIMLSKGDRVRLRPKKRADIFDTLLDGRIAIIEAVEEDFEENVHFAVVLEDDPGRDLGEMRQAGHRFFFSTDEVEPLAPIASERPS